MAGLLGGALHLSAPGAAWSLLCVQRLAQSEAQAALRKCSRLQPSRVRVKSREQEETQLTGQGRGQAGGACQPWCRVWPLPPDTGSHEGCPAGE